MVNRTAFNSVEAWLDGKIQTNKTYPEHFYQYPEVVQETLKKFYDVWKIPEGAVPNRRRKDKFEVWITDLKRLEDICGTQKNVLESLKMAREKYYSYDELYRFIIWRPLGDGMEKLIIWAMTEIKNRKKVEPNVSPIQSPIVEATVETKKQFAKKLKNIMREDED